MNDLCKSSSECRPESTVLQQLSSHLKSVMHAQHVSVFVSLLLCERGFTPSGPWRVTGNAASADVQFNGLWCAAGLSGCLQRNGPSRCVPSFCKQLLKSRLLRVHVCQSQLVIGDKLASTDWPFPLSS